jgi:hypothetical protein
LEEHAEDNFGEILPHVFFGDLTRYIVSRFLAIKRGRSTVEDRKDLLDMLQYLEDAYNQGDDDIENVIAVGFLERLPRPEEEGGELRNMLGPSLTRQLQVIG